MFLNRVKLLTFMCLLLLGVSVHSADKPLQVLATIKPLALIAQEITGPDIKVDILLPPRATPHHFTLRVSDMQRIERADVVLWVGPEFETVLQKSFSKHRALTMSDLTGLVWPTTSAEHEGHEHSGKDWHIWLNPQNALIIAQAIADELSLRLPVKALEFQERVALFSAKINVLEQRLRAELLPMKDQKLVVYHDAYRHYMEHYSLLQVAHFTARDERPLGAKLKYAMEQQVQQGQCLLANPFEDMPKARDVATRATLKLAMVDPLGREANTYDELMLAITKAISACHLVV